MIVSEADLKQIEKLRAGDDVAFTMLVEQHYDSMVRIAMIYVTSQEIAEDVVQETWIAVLKGWGGLKVVRRSRHGFSRS